MLRELHGKNLLWTITKLSRLTILLGLHIQEPISVKYDSYYPCLHFLHDFSQWVGLKKERIWGEVFSGGNRLRIIMSYLRWRYIYRHNPEVLLWCTVEPHFTGSSIVLNDFLVPGKSPYFFDLYFIFFTNLTMLMSCFTSIVLFGSYKRCYFS